MQRCSLSARGDFYGRIHDCIAHKIYNDHPREYKITRYEIVGDGVFVNWKPKYGDIQNDFFDWHDLFLSVIRTTKMRLDFLEQKEERANVPNETINIIE